MIRCSSGSIRCSSAVLAVQPIGDVYVQYLVLPSDGNCSIVASFNPSFVSSFFTCSAASWNIVEAWMRWKRVICSTYALAITPDNSSFTSLFTFILNHAV